MSSASVMRPAGLWRHVLSGLVLVAGLSGTGADHVAARDVPRDPAARQARIQQAVERIDGLLTRGAVEEAVNLAVDTLRSFPDEPGYSWRLKERLGAALLAAGRPAEAVPRLEEAILEAPWEASLHHQLARALMALGRRGRALGEFREAVGIAPRDCQLRLDFAQVLLDFSLTPEAAVEIAAAETACTAGNEDLVRLKARYSLATGDYAAALAPLRRLHGAHPNAEHRRLLAIALARTGSFPELLELLLPFWPGGLGMDEQLLVLEADRALGDVERARWLARSEDPPVAESALLWGLVSLICLESDLYEEGLRAADRAIALEPDSATYRNNRVVLLTRLGRHDEALQEWERVVALDPSLADTVR